MSLTVSAFASALTTMAVTGVTRTFTTPPTQINTADLPCIFPRLPESDGGMVSFSGAPGMDTVRLELVVVIEPWAQNTNAANFALSVTVTDNLIAAIKTEMATRKTIDDWRITSSVASVGAGDYWAIVAQITGSA